MRREDDDAAMKSWPSLFERYGETTDFSDAY